MTATGPAGASLVSVLAGILARYRRGEVDIDQAHQEAVVALDAMKDVAPSADQPDRFVAHVAVEGDDRHSEALSAALAIAAAGADPAGLTAEDCRHLLADIIARQRRGELTSRAAGREAFIVRALMTALLKRIESGGSAGEDVVIYRVFFRPDGSIGQERFALAGEAARVYQERAGKE